jgi:hypothetical protein
MYYSAPSLHPPVLKTPAHKDLLKTRLASIAARRLTTLARRLAPVATPIDIPLTTVSLASNFDAYIDVNFRGAAADTSVPLIVDSGNFSLIVPDYGVIAALPNFATDYTILADNVREPWGCAASILRGPIEIPTQGGGVYEIPNCVFYACTGPNANGELTANFGAGCISPWIVQSGITLQAPLSYNPSYPFVEFNYAPAGQVLTAGTDPNIAEGSSLTLYKSMPPGYQMFEIVPNLMWMSLIPRSLSIGGTATGWPGTIPSPIAMVDTGGGPVFLSDPNGYVYQTNWPQPVALPDWTSPDSVSCQSIADDITIGLGDGSDAFSYCIDTTKLPASVRGLTLVMCELCYYMMGNQGMNIGGLSALFNYILINYAAARVGLKAKPVVEAAATVSG